MYYRTARSDADLRSQHGHGAAARSTHHPCTPHASCFSVLVNCFRFVHDSDGVDVSKRVNFPQTHAAHTPNPSTLSMTMKPTTDLSLFADLGDVATWSPAAPGSERESAPWLATRGQTGFGSFERQVSGVRTRQASDSAGVKLLAPDVDLFVRDWLARRHPQRHGVTRPYLVVVNDAARIWSGKLFEHAEAIARRRRSRMNLVRADAGGGALTVSHVEIGARDEAQIHLYSVDVRERTLQSLQAARTLQTQCDLMVEIVGPMSADSLAAVLDRLRDALAAPAQPLRHALVLVSTTAAALREPLQRFVEEMGPRVSAATVGLVETAAQWRQVVMALAEVAQDEPPILHDAVTPDADDEPEAPSAEDLPRVIKALAQTEGTQWVALVSLDPEVHLIETADETGEPPFDAALSMAVLLAAEATAAGDVVRIETEATLTLGRVLCEPRLALVARFAKAEVPAAVADLLITRMCEEVESLQEGHA
jgi:hypothetical protein